MIKFKEGIEPNIRVGMVVQAYGFPILSGFKGENFYKVTRIEGQTVFFQRSNQDGQIGNIGLGEFSANIENVKDAIKSVESETSTNGLRIWKETKIDEMIVSDKTDGRVKQMMLKIKSSYPSLNALNYDTLNKTYLFAFGKKNDADKLEKDFKAARSKNPNKAIGKFEFVRSADYPNDTPPTFVKQFKINESVNEDLAGVAAGATGLAIGVAAKFLIPLVFDGLMATLYDIRNFVKPPRYIKFLKQLENNDEFNRQFIALVKERGGMKKFADRIYSNHQVALKKLPALKTALEKFYKEEGLTKNQSELLEISIFDSMKKAINQNWSRALEMLKKKYPDLVKDMGESVNEAANMLVYNVNADAVTAFLKKYPKVRTVMTSIAKKNKDITKGYKEFLRFKDKHETELGGRGEIRKSDTFGEKQFYKYDWMGTTGWAEIYQFIHGAKVESVNEAQINEWKLQLDLGKVNPSEFEDWASDSLQKKHKIKVSGSGKNWTIVGKGNDDRMGSSADWISQLLGKAWTINKIKVVQKESVNEEAPIYKDWDEFVRPDHIIVYLKDGKKLKIAKNKMGGKFVYYTILKAFNDNNYKVTNKIVGAMLAKLGESVNEGKYYVGYNKGRGQGKGVFKDTYSTYKEAQKEVEKIQKMMSGSHNMTAYYVADSKGEMVRETVTEARGPKIIQREFDKVVSEIEATLDAYKKAKGTPKEKPLVAKLKELNDKKKSLAKELEDRISGLYQDAELKISEITEKYLYPKGKSLKPGFQKTTFNIDKLVKYAKSWKSFYDDFKRKFKSYPKDNQSLADLKDLFGMYHPEMAIAEVEEIEGGKAEGLGLRAIAKIHNFDLNDLIQRFKKGVETEMEHTDNPNVAKEITLDHLVEDPLYYEKIQKIGL